MMRSRRFTLIAAATLAGSLLAGCGDAPGRTAVGLPTIRLGANGESAMVAGASPAADKMMVAWPTDFVFDGDLPDLGSDAPVYRFPGGQTADIERIAAIAAALDLEGEVEQVPADQGGGWRVGPADYSGPVLSVAADGLLSWWFSPGPSATTGWACAEPTVSSDGTTVPFDPCPMPEPPVGVPDAPTATSLALDLFDRLGVDTEGVQTDVYADDWSAWVTAYLTIDDVRTPMAWSVGFGADASITSASGVLASAEQVGAYPIVGTGVGLERLNDDSGRWTWFGGMMAADAGVRMMGSTGVAGSSVISGTDSMSVTGAAGSSETSGTGTMSVTVGGGAVAVSPPVSIDPSMAPPTVIGTAPDMVTAPVEPTVIHLTSVRRTLTTYWDVDSTVWLLPAYEFTSTDGGTWTVLAVDETYLDFPETTLPVTPGELGTVPSDSMLIDPMPEPVPAADAEAALLDLTEDEATAAATERGWTLRVVERDGESLAVTMDYSPTRVNVVITAGVVTAIQSIG